MSDEISLSEGWTLAAYVSANESLRVADKELQAERDRRQEQRFAEQEKAVEAALKSTREAILKAETANEKRFESVNEFRQTLSDQTKTFMPRSEAEARATSNADKITMLASRLDKIESRLIGKDEDRGRTTKDVLQMVQLVVGLLTILAVIIGAALIVNK